MAHVDIGSFKTKTGWGAIIKTVGPSGQVDQFEKDGYPSEEAAVADARKFINEWMLNLGLTGTAIPLRAEQSSHANYTPTTKNDGSTKESSEADKP